LVVVAAPVVPEPVPSTLTKPDDLTYKQERFAQHLAEHGSVIEAYRHAYNTKTANRNSLRSTAFNTANLPAVRARVAVLQSAAAARSATTNGELLAALEELVECDPTEVMAVCVSCCRHCHGAQGAYQ